MSRLIGITIFGVVIASVIEALQMYLPVRVTSLTDLILAVAGCMTGVFACEHGTHFYRTVTSRVATAVQLDSEGQDEAATMAPTDELIATLTDPYPGAPQEPSPTRPLSQPRSKDS